MEIKENPIRINRERNGCHVTVNTHICANEIKLLLEKFADEVSDIFVPAEILWDGNAYSFYIRHRQSLKEYLCRYEITVKDFNKLISKISKLIILTGKMNVSKESIVFNYDCVFIGKNFDNLEFVYVPGIDKDENFTGISDLLTVLAIHIKYENEKEEAFVKNTIQNVMEWEKGKNEFYFINETNRIISEKEKKYKNGKLKSWYPFVLFQIAAGFLIIMFLFMKSFNGINLFVWIIGLLFIISVDSFLIPKKNSKNNALYLKGTNLVAGKIIDIKDKSVLIGRNETTSSVYIKNAFVSRKHAEFYKKGDKYYIKDLFSTNGTYLENNKIDPNVEYVLQNKNEIMLGTSDVIFSVHKYNTIKILSDRIKGYLFAKR